MVIKGEIKISKENGSERMKERVEEEERNKQDNCDRNSDEVDAISPPSHT